LVVGRAGGAVGRADVVDRLDGAFVPRELGRPEEVVEVDAEDLGEADGLVEVIRRRGSVLSIRRIADWLMGEPASDMRSAGVAVLHLRASRSRRTRAATLSSLRIDCGPPGGPGTGPLLGGIPATAGPAPVPR